MAETTQTDGVRRRKQYSFETLNKAVEIAKRHEESIYSIAKRFGIPKTTISDRLKTGIDCYSKPVEKKKSKVKVEYEDSSRQKTFCCACLVESDYLYSENEKILTFNNLIGDIHVDFQLKFCNKCCKNLENFKNFKEKCLESIEILTKSIDFEMIEIKLEEDTLPMELKPEKFFTEDEDTEFTEHIDDEQEPATKIKQMKRKVKKADKNQDFDGKNLIYCGICKEHFKSTLVPHIYDAHIKKLGKDEYHCLVCKDNLQLKNHLAVRCHFDTHNTTENPLICKICGEVFNQRRAFFTHGQRHKLYECHHCQRKLSCRTRILEHIQTQHMNVKKCCYCPLKFTDPKLFEEHMEFEREKRKSGAVKRICDICGYEASGKAGLAGHKQRKHPARDYVCALCGGTFASKPKYNFHMITHHEEKTIQCSQCDKKFARNSDLNNHVRGFHEMRYAKSCDVCGKVFRTNSIMKKHKDIAHLNNYKFECKKCGRAFKVAALLKKHQYSHLQKRPYNCHICQTGYYMTDYLKSHYLKVHGLNLTNKEVIDVCVRVKIPKELL